MSFKRVNKVDKILDDVIASYPNVKNPGLLREIVVGALPRRVDGRLGEDVNEDAIRAAIKRIAIRSPHHFEFHEVNRIARIKNTPYSELTNDEERKIWRNHRGAP